MIKETATHEQMRATLRLMEILCRLGAANRALYIEQLVSTISWKSPPPWRGEDPQEVEGVKLYDQESVLGPK